MKIDINTANVTVNASLEELLRKKIGKLDRYFDHMIDVVLYLADDGHHAKSIELKVNVKNAQLFCKEASESFEQSIDLVVDNMARQLKKYKEKHA